MFNPFVMKTRKFFSVFLISVLFILSSFAFVGVASAAKWDMKEYKVIEFVEGKVKFNWDRSKDEYKKKFKKVKKRFLKIYKNGKLGNRKPEVNKPPVVEALPIVEGSNYPWHYDITATMFWLGEEAGPDNGWISNVSTAWESPVADSVNEWYIAVPYNDMEYVDGQTQNKAEVVQIPWYDESLAEGYDFYSYIKNRWIMVQAGDKVAYGQIVDSGPHGEELFDYVINGGAFSNPASSNNAGIDLSPVMTEHLGLDGRDPVDWKFVEESEVPEGPWKEHIETQQCVWGKYGDTK
jgi:hypothetical protein